MNEEKLSKLPWTDYELKLVRDPKYTAPMLAKEINRTQAAINTKRYQLRRNGEDIPNLSPGMWRNKLTPKQIETLCTTNEPITKLAKKWDLPVHNLYEARSYLLHHQKDSVKRPEPTKGKPWSRDEDTLFLDPNLSNSDIAKKLHRSMQSVNSRRYYLRRNNKATSSKHSNRVWTDERDRLILNSGLNANALAEKFNVSPNAVALRKHKLTYGLVQSGALEDLRRGRFGTK